MHGEYKVPGGKLVVVDLDVVDGVIADFRLAGRLLPRARRARSTRSTRPSNGLPADSRRRADRRRRAGRAARRTPLLLGFSPEAVADRHPPCPVRRRPAGATTTGSSCTPGRYPPALHLALDQVLAEEVGDGRRKPTLRIWEWDEPAVVIGSFQSVKNEVDPENAAEVRLPGRAPHQRRRRDVHGGRLRHHLLDLRARPTWCRA